MFFFTNMTSNTAFIKRNAKIIHLYIEYYYTTLFIKCNKTDTFK